MRKVETFEPDIKIILYVRVLGFVIEVLQWDVEANKKRRLDESWEKQGGRMFHVEHKP